VSVTGPRNLPNQIAARLNRLGLRRPHALTGRVAPTGDAGPDIAALGTAAEGPLATETETGLLATGVDSASLGVAEAEESAASDMLESPIKTAPPPGTVEADAIVEPEADSTEVSVLASVEVGLRADATADLEVR